MLDRIALAMAVALSTACGSTILTTSSPPQSARPPDCEFDVFTAPPERGYVEVGVVDQSPGAGGGFATKIGDFKENIRAYVCKAAAMPRLPWPTAMART